MKNFLDFIREQGVVGLAVGFILGGAVSKVVSAFVTDIINPLLSFILGSASGLKNASLEVGSAHIMVGDFLSVTIDFIIVSFVVYVGIKIFKISTLDKPKV